MSRVPARLSDVVDRSRRDLAEAVEAQSQTELAIFHHLLAARYLAETERIDIQALVDVGCCAIEEEQRLLASGLERANGSAAAVEIVARYSGLINQLNTTRIARRFSR